jgi:hypothetical protein
MKTASLVNSSWLQIQRFHVRLPALPVFLRRSGSGTRFTQPHEDNWGATWKKSSGSGPENRESAALTTQHPLLTKVRTNYAGLGGRSLSRVLLQTNVLGVCFVCCPYQRERRVPRAISAKRISWLYVRSSTNTTKICMIFESNERINSNNNKDDYKSRRDKYLIPIWVFLLLLTRRKMCEQFSANKYKTRLWGWYVDITIIVLDIPIVHLFETRCFEDCIMSPPLGLFLRRQRRALSTGPTWADSAFRNAVSNKRQDDG